MGAPASPLLATAALTKSFAMGRQVVVALDNVTTTFGAGGLYAVMGPSGSGKSTLLYLLGGLDRPSSGQIRYADRALERLDENALAAYRRQQVGFVFQAFNLVPALTALENVAFPLRFSGVRRRERQGRAAALLQQVGLGDRLFHRPAELSGGQQQRVAIARALINNPPLILADEPTGNLDTASGHAVMQLLARLHQQGHTIVVVTHDPRMMAYATETRYMLDGRFVSAADYETALQMAHQEPAPQ